MSGGDEFEEVEQDFSPEGPGVGREPEASVDLEYGIDDKPPSESRSCWGSSTTSR